MDRALRVIVADDDQQAREFYQQILPDMGHKVIFAASSGSELVRQCEQLKPDLVISDIKMPDLDGLDASEQIYASTPVPIILVSGYHDAELIERAQENHILAYLVKPVTLADMEVAISLAMKRFQEFEELRLDTSNLRQALQDRKIIERAKNILMKLGELHEHDAFRRLQKLASRQNKKLVQVAEMIVTAEMAFGPPDRR
ncbi:MAG TPA: response regulator [Pirellulales bacterium]|jgi:response regulator NasT|nr:response regulator [Pirellulales bacterium]